MDSEKKIDLFVSTEVETSLENENGFIKTEPEECERDASFFELQSTTGHNVAAVYVCESTSVPQKAEVIEENSPICKTEVKIELDEELSTDNETLSGLDEVTADDGHSNNPKAWYNVINSWADKRCKEERGSGSGCLKQNDFMIRKVTPNKSKRSSLLKYKLAPSGVIRVSFVCDHCPYRAKNQSSLNKHTLMHTGEKLLCCNVCSFSTTQKQLLDSHMETHNGEKPYGCEFCPYKARLIGSLNVHMQIHTAGKPYSCEFCPYKARVRETMNKHVALHVFKKSVSCMFCSYKTTEKILLKKHMTKHYSDSKTKVINQGCLYFMNINKK